MKRFLHLLRQPVFHLFLFGLALVLLSWPFLAVAGRAGLSGLCLYLFLLWSVLVLSLLWIGRSLGEDTADAADDEQRGGPDV